MIVLLRPLLLFLSLSPVMGGAASLLTLRACFENSDAFPWVLQSGNGLVQYHLKRVAEQVGINILMVPLPWKRCIAQVSSGQMDAAMNMSYSPERALNVGAYPMLGERPDTDRRLLIESYSLYQLKDGENQWDGSVLKVTGIVAAQSGFSIVDLLHGAGAEVDDSSRDPLIILKKMVMGRAVAAALQTEVGDSLLAANPELQAQIERLVPVLVEKPYYLVFSHPFRRAYPHESQRVWDAIEVVRNSAEYQAYAISIRANPPSGG